jgi:hypothetical protein
MQFMKNALFVCLGILISSCSKKDDSLCLEGKINNTLYPVGAGATGAAWAFVSADSVNVQSYFLKDLPEDFKVDDLPVSACIAPTDQQLSCYNCNRPQLYRVTSVRRR